jgi:hypothetical protein
VAGVLVVIIGLPLYLVPQNSEEYFSWSVHPDLSAAFLGGAYLAAAVIEFLAARERTWARARIAVPAVLVFTFLTLLVTLANNDQYRYDAPGVVASVGSWLWLAVYAGVPPIMAVILVLQLRRREPDPDREAPMSMPLRRVLAAGGLLLIAGGFLLLLVPDSSSWMWSWSISDLTARAYGAWLVGFGIALVHMTWEADWFRVRPATAGAAALGALQLVAILRYIDVPDWGSPQAWVYVAVLASFIALGVVGLRTTRHLERVEAFA